MLENVRSVLTGVISQQVPRLWPRVGVYGWDLDITPSYTLTRQQALK